MSGCIQYLHTVSPVNQGIEYDRLVVLEPEFIVTKAPNSVWNADFRCHAKLSNSWHEWRIASNSSNMVPMMDFFNFGQPSWISSRSPITVPRFWMRGPPNSGTKNSLQNPMHFGNHISGSSVQVTSICDRIVIFFNFGQQMA